MIKSNLGLNYGVPVFDISPKGHATQVVLMYDFEDPQKLNVWSKSGLRKYSLNIRELNSTFFYSNKPDITLTISLAKNSLVYKFISDEELDNVYNQILGDNYLHFGLKEAYLDQLQKIAMLRETISGWTSSTAEMADSFLLVARYQLSMGSELGVGQTIRKSHFEAIAKSYLKTPEIEPFDKCLKEKGFPDKQLYDQNDIVSFLFHEELCCEMDSTHFRPEVY